MVIKPSSIRRRLISLTCVAERPSASSCIEAEGHTIGRLPLLPVLRLSEAKQPVYGVHDPWRNAKLRRRRLQSRQQLLRRFASLRQAGETFRSPVGLQRVVIPK
jgi:hypothetical protein